MDLDTIRQKLLTRVVLKEPHPIETGPFLGIGLMPLSLGRVIFCFFTKWFAGRPRPDIGRTYSPVKGDMLRLARLGSSGVLKKLRWTHRWFTC